MYHGLLEETLQVKHGWVKELFTCTMDSYKQLFLTILYI